MDAGIPFPDLTDGPVRLRPRRTADDLPDVLALCQDPDMRRWTTIPLPYEERHALAFLSQAEPDRAAGRGYGLTVEYEGRFAGQVDLRPQSPGAAEVGYALTPSARGHGVMTRALRLVLPWGFEALDLDVVHWRARVGNWPSRRVAWSVGFRHDGAVRDLLPRGAGPGRAAEPRRHDGWVASLRRGEPLEPARGWLVPPLLRTADAVLRAHRDDDAARMAQACADPVTQQWLPDLPAPYTQDDARAHLAEVAEWHAGEKAVAWAVADPGSDALLAEVAVFGVGGGSRRGEIGYWAHPDARRRRVVTRAVTAATAHALRPAAGGGLGLDSVFRRAAEGNEASIGVARQAGFLLAGRDSRAERLRDGTVCDHLRYERLA